MGRPAVVGPEQPVVASAYRGPVQSPCRGRSDAKVRRYLILGCIALIGTRDPVQQVDSSKIQRHILEIYDVGRCSKAVHGLSPDREAKITGRQLFGQVSGNAISNDCDPYPSGSL